MGNLSATAASQIVLLPGGLQRADDSLIVRNAAGTVTVTTSLGGADLLTSGHLVAVGTVAAALELLSADLVDGREPLAATGTCLAILPSTATLQSTSSSATLASTGACAGTANALPSSSAVLTSTSTAATLNSQAVSTGEAIATSSTAVLQVSGPSKATLTVTS